MKLSREAYLPKPGSGFLKVESKTSSAIIYYHPKKNQAMGFQGRQSAPAWNYLFKNRPIMMDHITKWFANVEKSEKFRQDQKKVKQESVVNHEFRIGSVLMRMWGWEQTNVNFYEVVRLVGKQTVIFREIAQERVEDEWMQGTCVPVKGQYIGAEEKRRVYDKNNIRYNSYSFLSIEIPTIVDGVEIFRSHRWSSYA